MPIPTYGAPPLAKFFLVVRVFQIISFAAIVGITANFVAEITSNSGVVPPEIIGTLTVASVSFLYILITIPFYLSNGSRSLLVTCAFDTLLLLAFIIISIIIGKPLSYLSCPAIPSDSTGNEDSSSASAFVQSLGNNVKQYDGDFFVWTGATRNNCYEAKAVWGLCIANCVLFAASALVLPGLYAKQKRAFKMGSEPYY